MNTYQQQDTHSKIIGYLLWIFGFTGAHRFYYGKPVTGTIWFFTLGLLGIGWLIDLFLIPSMDREADLRFTSGGLDYNVAWILLVFLGIFGVHRFTELLIQLAYALEVVLSAIQGRLCSGVALDLHAQGGKLAQLPA